MGKIIKPAARSRNGTFGASNPAARDWLKLHGWSIVEEVLAWASAECGHPGERSPADLVRLILEGQRRAGEEGAIAKAAITNWRQKGYFGLQTQGLISAITGIPEAVLLEARRKKERGDNTPIQGFKIPGPPASAGRKSGIGPVRLAAPDAWPSEQPAAKPGARPRRPAGSARRPIRPARPA